MGKSLVGKTSLIYKYLNNICPSEHEPTIEETYISEFTSEKGEERKFKIIDTSGEENNQNFIEEWICNAHGFILVYSIDNKESFEKIKKIFEFIKKNNCHKLPIVLVGNKSDMENNRKVAKQEAEEFAKLISASYFELSALKDDKEQCKTIFQLCANKIIKNDNDDNHNHPKCYKCIIF